MKRYEFIKPAQGFKVWDPQTGAFLPEAGRRVLYDQYWSRRQTEGAIVIVPTATPPVSKSAPPPVTKKADPPATKQADPPVAENGIAKTAQDKAAPDRAQADKKSKKKTKK